MSTTIHIFVRGYGNEIESSAEVRAATPAAAARKANAVMRGWWGDCSHLTVTKTTVGGSQFWNVKRKEEVK